MKNKKWTISLSCIMLAASLCACGNEIPELSETENAMVCQYAANLLLSCSTNYESRLIDTSTLPEEEIRKQEEERRRQEDLERQQQKQEQQSKEETKTEDTSENKSEEAPAPSMSIAQVLGMDGFDISYTGFRLEDSYPSAGADAMDMVFAMSAAPGNSLLILDIDVTNQTGAVKTFDTLTKSAKYKVKLGEGSTQNVLVTMLTDDFSAMQTDIEPGSTLKTVLVAEVSKDMAESLQTVGLEVLADGQKTVITK